MNYSIAWIPVSPTSIHIDGYTALSLVFSTNVVCVKILSKNMVVSNIMMKPNNTLKIRYNNMSSFLFQNTIQLTLLDMHQCSHVIPQIFKSYCSHNSCESFGHAHYTLIINPLSLHSSWYWETFVQSSCQIAQFLRSKNRQKDDQFFYQMSDFCKNCNPALISYHRRWWMFGWYSICRNM